MAKSDFSAVFTALDQTSRSLNRFVSKLHELNVTLTLQVAPEICPEPPATFADVALSALPLTSHAALGLSAR